MDKIEIRKKRKDLGIELLRFLLCLWIVTYHCAKSNIKHSIYINRLFHVPTFFLISFYFYYPTLSRRLISKITARFQRILIPYILWPLIIMIMNNILMQFFSIGQFKRKIRIKDFYIQILVGDGYYSIFWFQFNLIFTTLFFSIISFIDKVNILQIFSVLLIISLYLNFSGINYQIFKYNNLRKSLGPLIELMPISIIGCFFNSVNLIKKMKFSYIYFRAIIFSFLYFLFEYDLFITPQGFRYPNVLQNILASSALLLFFSSLSLDIQIINKIIEYLSQNTGGIYYIHLIFREYFQKYIKFFGKKNYGSAFAIYIISYLLCFFGHKCFYNYKLKYLFI